MPAALYAPALKGTENRMFQLQDGLTLAPEVTNFIRSVGPLRLGASKLYYVARCFRDERTTDASRLREFTQIGVELLSPNPLDARKTTRADAIKLMKELLPGAWRLQDDAPRGLNLYEGKAFEIYGQADRRQLLGGGPYPEGAGWALGLERLMLALTEGPSEASPPRPP